MNHYLIILILFTYLPFSKIHAQHPIKIGYVDKEYVLKSLPAYQLAQKNFKKYVKRLQDSLQQKQKALHQYLSNTGCVGRRTSDKYNRQVEKQLNSFYKDITHLQKNAQKLITDKERALLAPINQNIEKAIHKISQAHQFTFILKKEKIRFAKPEHNISYLVLKELGIGKR
ncbi:hypothetical protein BKI52_16640 [marine bacterium AO1-C]|nr:hypothetical protein BKI52_16640 [marine bacterium AO1-C]